MVYLFDVAAYFILLRETLEITIVLAVLFGFIDSLSIDNKLKKKFKRHLWIGAAAGLGVSLLIGVVFIVVFYVVKRNLWDDSESAWVGAFSLIASVVITAMALGMLRVHRWKAKWENKLKEATDKYLKKHEQGNKWALVLLPLTVVCREGVEAIVFIAGIGFDKSPSGIPIPAVLGIISGFFIGYLIYKGSHKLSLKLFFGITTMLLLFIGAGFFSNSIHELQEATGSYEHVLWELKCCDPEAEDGQFWDLMKSLFGWTNRATIGTTVGYFVYWLVIGNLALFLIFKERKISKLNEMESQLTNEGDDREKDTQITGKKDTQTTEEEKDAQITEEKDIQTTEEKDTQITEEKDAQTTEEKKDARTTDEKDTQITEGKDTQITEEKDTQITEEKDIN